MRRIVLTLSALFLVAGLAATAEADHKRPRHRSVHHHHRYQFAPDYCPTRSFYKRSYSRYRGHYGYPAYRSSRYHSYRYGYGSGIGFYGRGFSLRIGF